MSSFTLSEPANGSIPHTTNAGHVLLANGLQALSCLRCAHRKVKCDRIDPCSNCVKHGVPCEYREGMPYKRKKRHHSDANATIELQARLKKYEEMLKGLGVHPDAIDSTKNGVQVSPKDGHRNVPMKRECKDKSRGPNASESYARMDPLPGRLIVQDGKSRYVEGNIWTKMGEVSENASALLPDSSDDEDEDEKYNTPGMDFRSGDLVLGASPRISALYELHPSPTHFTKLWQAFLDNVHPITMVIHGPSTRKALLEAIKNQKNASKDVEALLFAVLATAVMSLNDDDCRKQFLESRASLLAKYRQGARQALTNAKFLLSSSFAILQAYTLYLFAVRPEVDPRVLWNLSGIAVRNAHRLGIHKDLQTNGLTPFEVEMRRRLWYQIVMIDIMSCQQSGCSPTTVFQRNTWAPPTNINDADLDPNMTEAPKDREGATDMLFCRLRHKMFSFMNKVNADKGPLEEGRWTRNGGEIGVQEKDNLIDTMEKEIELELLRYCDFLQPIHFMTTSVARLIICKMRFSAHHPRRFQLAGQEIPQSEKDFLFKTALKVIEYDNLGREQPMVRRFMWHSYLHFQWSCLIHVLSELKTKTHGEDADRAWHQISIAYDHRPEIAQGKKQKFPLYTAVNRVALEAWACREKALASRQDEHVVVPDFIHSLREHQFHTHSPGTKQQPSDNSQGWISHQQLPYQQYPTPVSFPASLHHGDGNSIVEMPTQQQIGAVNYSDMYNPQTFSSEPVDWSLFDSLIDGEMMQGFGDATLSGAAFQPSFWDAKPFDGQ